MNVRNVFNSKFRKSCLFAAFGVFSSHCLVTQAAQCNHIIYGEWSTGFVAAIQLTNDSESTIEGWSVNWEYQGASIDSFWGADIVGSGSYVASDLGWNSIIYPGDTVEIGFVASKNVVDAPVETPLVSGDICPSPATMPPSVMPISSEPSSPPDVCGDAAGSLIINGLDEDDEIHISWMEGWTGAIKGWFGNGEIPGGRFGYCGPIDDFPPTGVVVLDSAGYSCIVNEERVTEISCSK